MKISTKGRYGVRFLMDLAINGNGGNVALKEVAKRQAISQKYLWQIVTPLKKEGLIRASPGPHGGYTLTREPATVTLRDILTALEGDLFLVDCMDEPASCTRSDSCASREVWTELQEKINRLLESTTLKDMVEKQQAINQAGAIEFYI